MHFLLNLLLGTVSFIAIVNELSTFIFSSDNFIYKKDIDFYINFIAYLLNSINVFISL